VKQQFFIALVAFVLAASSAFAQSNLPPPEVPAAPSTQVNSEDASPVRFAYGGDVAQIPAQFVSNLVLLPVTINQGEPSLFLLDSTAATSSIDPKRAAALGLVDAPASGPIHGVVLTMPGIAWQPPALNLVSRDALGPQVGKPYQGTLGLDFLSRVVVQIDYARHTVQIYDPHSYTPPEKKPPIQPIKWTSGLPYVSCKFSVKGEHDSTAQFLLNSAQAAGIVFRDRYVSAHEHDFGHFKTIPGMYAGESGEIPAAVGRLNSFGLEKLQLPNLIATLPHGAIENESDSSSAGIIGGAYLRRFILIFDLPHQQIIFVPNIEYIDRDDIGMSGLTILAQGSNHKTFEVAFVVPGSPGAQAGVREGDIIEAVDGEPAADLTLDQVQDLFRQLDEKYKILLSRDGKTITVNLQTRRLI